MESEEIKKRLAELHMTNEPEEPEMMDSGGDQFRTVEFLVQDESIPKVFRDIFWAFADKENEISKMGDRDIHRALLLFDIAKLKYMTSRPEYEYSFPESLNITQMRHKFWIKLLRSHMGFERRQISGHETSKKFTMTNPQKKSKKVFSNLFGKGE